MLPGQELCYLNKQESLQVTFHFEHDCLRLASCTASPNSHMPSPKQSFKTGDKEHIGDSEEKSAKAATNSHNSSALPFRKRKIKNQFLSNEIYHSAEDRIGRCETEKGDSNDDITDDIMLPGTSFYPNAVAMPTDEYLLQQCGNLTINNGTRVRADSPLFAGASVDFDSSSGARTETQTNTVSQLDDFITTGSSNRLNYKSGFSKSSPVNQSRSINRQIPEGKDLYGPSTSNYRKKDKGPKILVEYLDDSDDETENFQITERYKSDNLMQNNNICINSTSSGVAMMLSSDLDKSDSLIQENEAMIDFANGGAMIDFVSQIDSTNNSSRLAHVDSVLAAVNVGEDVKFASENETNSDGTNFGNKLCVSISLDNLEVISEEPCYDGTISKQNCAILENENCENLEQDTLQKDPRVRSAKSKDNSPMKRHTNKLVCLAEHSDIKYLNDIHLNRSCFKALELLSKKRGSTSLSLLYNTTRLCFLALQAKALTFDPVTIVTGEEHHGTIETVMASNNLKLDDVSLLDLPEGEGDHGKYDVLMFDLVEPCGALRQQILEDIAVLR